MRAHEQTVIDGRLSEHDAVRIAAVVNAAAVALELAAPASAHAATAQPPTAITAGFVS